MDQMLSKVALDKGMNNENWNSLKKLWLKLKIVRNQAKQSDSKEIINMLKKEEIETSRKIVKLSKTVRNGKGDKIAIPFFAILGSKQDGK